MIKTQVYGLDEYIHNILLWAGCTIQPVYDKGCKAEHTRKRLYSWITYPEGAAIKEDLDFPLSRDDPFAAHRAERVTLPGDLPGIMILWGYVPADEKSGADAIADYPFYLVDMQNSSPSSLEWYYDPQQMDEYDMPHLRSNRGFEWKERYFVCNCCKVKTFYQEGRGISYESRDHNHHPDCIHLKQKVK